MRMHALRNATAIAYNVGVTAIDPIAREARECFQQQATAVAALAGRVDGSFSAAVHLLYGVEGHVVVTGIGKSGLIGKKLAATLASTGTPSFFLHAAEAFHGDLGMITDHDAVVLLSYSGETEEVTRLLPHLRTRAVPTIGLVGDPGSTLAHDVDVALDVSVDKEICPNNLAPTSSTMATLAMGDALAVMLIRMRGFVSEDFARLHPGGSLGRRLLSRVEDAMVTGPLPMVQHDASARDCLLALARSRLDVLLVMKDDRVCGLVTQNELQDADQVDTEWMRSRASTIMNPNPPQIAPDATLDEADRVMLQAQAAALVVVGRDNHLCGIYVASGGE